MTVPPDALVVFAFIAVAILLFVTEALSPDTTAMAVIVGLVVLEPYTHVPASDAISGFASPATVTILAMYVLSGGIENTGVIDRLGDHLSTIVGTDSDRLLGVTVGVTAPLAGVVNNTPVVAVFVPMIVDLADRVHVSPSKLLIPLSYAAMLGGTLTLIGTSTNLVASDLSARLIGRGFGMFEFTGLGAIVLVVGLAYLLTVAPRLLPERIRAVDLVREYRLSPYLWRLYVGRESPLVGATIEDAFAGASEAAGAEESDGTDGENRTDGEKAGGERAAGTEAADEGTEADDAAETSGEIDADLDVLQIVRGGRAFVAPGTDQDVRHRDRLTVRASEATARALADRLDLRLLPRARITEAELDRPEGRGRLVEAVVRPGSSLVGSTIAEATVRDRYRATVLAIRRGGEIVHEGLAGIELSEGDGLLLHATAETIDALRERGELIVAETTGGQPSSDAPAEGETARALAAIGILGGVIALAALGVLEIVIAALAGVVAMIVAGITTPREAYDAVHWDVIFLLAGVFPLGLALQRSGGAEVVGGLVSASAAVLPPIGVLAVVYLLTALLASVITPVASIVLMLPVAVDTATRLDANGFAFVLAATFAAASAFLTPIGYQTNLMVYSAGGYRFTDYVRVGAPLQLLHVTTVTLGIALFWGVT